jgi:NADH:ubiquinone oxidoreductase subunit 5 (subunit L)/multisubunit Na+/H+ antiporter MnhA subunit
MNRKWFVDEIYGVLILKPYAAASRFLADEVDGRFWHDWFHEKVLAGTYNFLSRIALNKYADQRGIDSFFNGLGQWTQDASSSLRRVQNGFVRSYALFVLLGVVAMVGYLVLK